MVCPPGCTERATLCPGRDHDGLACTAKEVSELGISTTVRGRDLGGRARDAIGQ